MERVEAPRQLEGQEVPSLAPFPAEPVALEALVTEARSEGREALTRLHAALGTLQPTEANGAQLLRLLDERAFDELRGDDGTLTRALAVETLLRLGYPWALSIHPDELAWYRSLKSAEGRLKWLIFSGILAVGGLSGLFLWLF